MEEDIKGQPVHQISQEHYVLRLLAVGDMDEYSNGRNANREDK